VPDVDEGEEPAADASGSDNSEAALALLRALARADPQVLMGGTAAHSVSISVTQPRLPPSFSFL
jgi:hypothetical protein